MSNINYMDVLFKFLANNFLYKFKVSPYAAEQLKNLTKNKTFQNWAGILGDKTLDYKFIFIPIICQ